MNFPSLPVSVSSALSEKTPIFLDNDRYWIFILKKYWNFIAGEEFSKKALPLKIENNFLYIFVDNFFIENELKKRAKNITEIINLVFGKRLICGLKFKKNA